jgi:pyridoxamine 5'-phosphate oxidase
MRVEDEGRRTKDEGWRLEKADGLDNSPPEVAADPIWRFALWLNAAQEARLPEPTAMTLATADDAGVPAARMVLLKDFDERGFVFYTHLESDKGRDLAANPRAALVFYWAPLERQVRVTGDVAQVSAAESDAYFASRSRAARLGAWASRQSKVIPNRAALEARLADVEALYPGEEIPRPAYWGGYRVAPRTIEFWQGRPGRLHDRLRYRAQADGEWLIERLSP